MDLPKLPLVLRWLVTLAVGFAGGVVAQRLGAPLPWLLGGMAATAVAALGGLRPFGQPLAFPMSARLVLVPVIGVLIGGAVSPDVLSAMPGWWPGLVAVALFVPLAHGMNYWLLRRVGGLPHATAYFGGMPGGLIESIEIARAHGADVTAVSVLQFARVATTVTAVPLIFGAVAGRAVGSAGGQSMGAGVPLTLPDAVVLIACGVIGYRLANRLKLPAGQILGPIVASGIAHGVGLTAAAPPALLVQLAQLVIGITLGLRFRGLEMRSIGRYFALSALSVAAMLMLGVLLSLPVAAVGTAPVPVMVLSLSPGGVVEMGLIALSLQASPIFVTAHHLVRIVLTVTLGLAGWKRFGDRG